MNKLLAILLFLSVVGGFSSCRKDVDAFVPYENSIDAIESLLKSVPDPATVTVFEPGAVATDLELFTASGAILQFLDPDNLFVDGSGEKVLLSQCGEFRIEITEAYRKGDWLARGLNTSDKNGNLIAPDLFFKINFYCGSTPLFLYSDRDVKVRLPFVGAQDDRNNYLGAITSGNNYVWENSGEPVFKAEWPNPNNPSEILNGYEVLVKHPGWNGAAKPATSGPVTPNCIALESPNNFENTLAFAVLPNTGGVIEMKKDVANNQFCAQGIPLGQPVQFILISKQGDQYFLGNKTESAQDNGIVTINQLPSSSQDIVSYFRGL